MRGLASEDHDRGWRSLKTYKLDAETRVDKLQSRHIMRGLASEDHDRGWRSLKTYKLDAETRVDKLTQGDKI